MNGGEGRTKWTGKMEKVDFLKKTENYFLSWFSKAIHNSDDITVVYVVLWYLFGNFELLNPKILHFYISITFWSNFRKNMGG